MERAIEVMVIGAGVVGLAVARAFSLAGREVVVVETERTVGAHTSSRNSEVVHAGFYYQPGSLKADLCVAGRRALYAYAEAKGIAHRRLGKLVVATDGDEVAALDGYRERGAANGVEGLELIGAAQARKLEPEVRCSAALWSPATGIVDAHGLMAALRDDAERAGAMVVLRAPVLGGTASGSGIELSIGGASPSEVRCSALINAAGLWAPDVARSLVGLAPAAIPVPYYARGHYFLLAGPSPFRHLVYPVAVAGGLGVHLTLDLAGQARFGPDLEWIEGVDYRFDEGRRPAFEAAIRRYWPALPDGALRPGYTGVRPKISRAQVQDFVIQGPAEHGVPGLVNLFGIESPGLTAALAIADRVASLLA